MNLPLLSLLPLGGLLASGLAIAAPAKPNVLIVITDDQGYGDFSAHGNPVVKTPSLDRLRTESVRFTDFHVAPICTPTRSQLLTGLDALRNGAQTVSNGRDLIRPGLPTMADAFAAGGYRCGLFGKWHLGDNYPYRPTDRGFHEVVSFPSSQVTSAPDHWDNDCLDDIYLHNNRRERYQGYATDVFFNESMKWMRAEAAAGRPFLCYLATPAAHTPLLVPESYQKLYAGAQLPGVPPEKHEEVIRFFAMIANIDANMARLDTFLRESGLRDNTIVIFLTDNGTATAGRLFNAGMRGAKFSLFEGGHRVPLFIRWPGGQLLPPGDIAEPAQAQDILPTLLDLCGIKPPPAARCDGISLAPRLRGESLALPDRMFVVNYVNVNKPAPLKEHSAVLWGRWRLVQNRQLFDLATDPGQATDVINQHPEVAARMRAHLDAWWAGVEPVVNDFVAIPIGTDTEPETQLGPQDRMDSILDQRSLILSASAENGPWNLDVTRAGDYLIELRRWSRETGAPIPAGLPERKFWDGAYPAGKALPITQAKIQIGPITQTRPVAATDRAALFPIALPAGRTQLTTAFLDAAGQELCGAYYVYVQRK